MKREDWNLLAVTVGCIVVFVGLLGGLILGEDTDRWIQIDNDKTCYVHVSQDRNIWFTPGETKDVERTTYCKQ